MWVPIPLVLHLSHSTLTRSHFKLPTHSSNFTLSFTVSHSLTHTSNVPLSLQTSPSLSQSHLLTLQTSLSLFKLQRLSKTLLSHSVSLRCFVSLHCSVSLRRFLPLQTLCKHSHILSDPLKHSHTTLSLYIIISVFWVASLVGIWVLVLSGFTSITSNDSLSLSIVFD